MRALAFFDTRFQSAMAGDPWQTLKEAQPASRQHGMLNRPGRLGAYDLADPVQAAAVVAAAVAAGLDGFVVDCHPTEAGYLTGAETLSPHLPAPFGLAYQWPLGRDRFWAEIEDDTGRWERIRALIAAIPASPSLSADGRIILIVDRPELLKPTTATLRMLRQAAADAGLPGLYLMASQPEQGNALVEGYDALVDPGPADWASCAPLHQPNGLDRLEMAAGLRDTTEHDDRYFHAVLFAITRMARRGTRGKAMPRVFPAYQNWASHPTGGATLLVEPGSSANRRVFGSFLENGLLYAARNFAPDEALCFIDSWNGWLDGSQIEPSLLDGDLVYDMVRQAIDRARFVVRNSVARSPGPEPALSERIEGLCRALGRR
jgi:hypothetical protein